MRLGFSGMFAIAGALALAGCQSYPATPPGTGTGAVAAAENVQRPKRQRTVQQFTKRLVLMLDRDGLVTLDDPEFPETCTLNREGRALAERIDAQRAQAVRA